MLLNGHLEKSFARYTLFVDSYPDINNSYYFDYQKNSYIFMPYIQEGGW